MFMKYWIRIIYEMFLLMCVLIVAGIIFRFSSENADESTNTASAMVSPVIQQLEESRENHYVSLPEYYKISEFIRDIGHFIEFGILSVFVYLLIGLHVKRVEIITFGICALYAISDEIHQIFVAGRGISIVDWVIDCAGASIGIFLLCLITKYIKRVKEKRRENTKEVHNW